MQQKLRRPSRFIIAATSVLILAALPVRTAAVEIQFAAFAAIEDPFLDTRELIAVDLDGDGDLDLFGSAESDDDVVWWENTASDASAWSRHDLALEFDLARGIAVGDLDGDGDSDLLGAGVFEDEIRWWKNVFGESDPCGSDFCEGLIDSFADGPHRVEVADFDRDGDLDVVATVAVDEDVIWYENTAGDASAWTEHTIEGSLAGVSALAVGDLDGDGDVDVLAGSSFASSLIWYENNLDGANLACVTDWCDSTVDTGATGRVGVADVDGDGDLDLLETRATAPAVRWWENDTGDGSTWTERVVTTTFSLAAAISGVDLDLDGDLDLLVEGIDDPHWMENIAGDGSTWTEHNLGPIAPYHLVGADLDGDGDLDLAGASEAVDDVGWWENLTIHRSAVFPVEESISDSSFIVPQSAQAVDMDGDGDVDIIGGSFDTTGVFFDAISWWENTEGDGSSWSEQVVSDDEDGVRSVFAADVDLDGDLDILAAIQNSNEISWWENDGLPCGGTCSWTKQVIVSTFLVARDVEAADLDGDGDVDVLGAAVTDGIRWWQHDGSLTEGTVWHENIVDATLGAGVSVTAADLDADGDLDVLATDSLDDEVMWWENDGSPCFGTCSWPFHSIASIESPWSTIAADLDGDGHLDVVTATAAPSSQGKVIWWENTGPCVGPCSWPEHVIASPYDDGSSIFTADLDLDGDLDVLATRQNHVTWWENTGPCDGVDGACDDWVMTTISSSFAGAESVSAMDLDGDGDADVLAVASGFGASEISWWQNLGGQFTLPTTDAVTQATPNEGASDVLLLAIDGVHRGLAGEAAAEISTIELLFEVTPGDPLTDSEISNLVDDLEFYLDNGDGIFDPGGLDPVVFQNGAPLIADGLVVTSFFDGDSRVEIAQGASPSWWVSVDLAPSAGTAVAESFIVTHVTESTSTGEIADTEIPLILEYTANVSSAPVAVNATPLLSAPIGDRIAGVGGELTLDVAQFFDDPDLDSLDFSAVGLPPSLSLSLAGLLSGTPTADDLTGSPYAVVVTAVDPGGLEVDDSFELEVRVAEVFADGFESGNTSSWSATVP